MSRFKFRFLIAICCAPLLPGQPAPAQEMRRIHYGTTASPSHLPVWVAKDAGFFARHGLNVEPVQVRGGTLITLAIITGDLPLSGVGAESVAASSPDCCLMPLACFSNLPYFWFSSRL